MNSQRLKPLIDAWRDDDLSEDQAEELNQMLRESGEARRAFSSESQLHGVLHCAAAEAAVERVADLPAVTLQDGSRVLRGDSRAAWLMFASTIAAGLFVAVGMPLWNLSSQPAPVAKLTSSENAAWESNLPTTAGSELTPGILTLKSGVATIRFISGAEMVLGAPARVQLISRMKARLSSGSAVMHVPDSAIGFVLETPDGYAVDFGTRFAISVDREGGQTDFELIEGEIEVHRGTTGESLKLNQVGTTVSVSEKSFQLMDQDASDEELETNAAETGHVIRVGTGGRCGSAMVRSSKRHKYIRPELLSVKQTKSGKWDFRSFFEFDLSKLDLDQTNSARLRLNLVPSDRGLASRLPKMNRFAIYGMTNRDKEDWAIESSWDDAPGPEDGILLGTFDIPRSEDRGVFGIENQGLLEFLRQRRGQRVTLVIVRETTSIDGTGPALVHQFASDQHPESVGPLLEFTFLK